MAKCKKCEGAGVVENIVCNDCNGSGCSYNSDGYCTWRDKEFCNHCDLSDGKCYKEAF